MAKAKNQRDRQSALLARRHAKSSDIAPVRASSWLTTASGAVLLGAIIVGLYTRSVHAPFIFDDEDIVLHNPSIVHLWPLVGDNYAPGPLNPPTQISTAGRPLVNLSLAANYHFGRLEPTGYHVFSIAVHLLSALLVWAIVRRTLCLARFGGRFDDQARILGFLSALIWAIHPIQTEAVAYVTQRTELMMACLYLATLYAALRYWEAQTPRSRAVWCGLAIFACLLGMACKEMMVTAPVVLLLFERTFVAGSFRGALRNSWPLYVGLASTWLPLLLLNLGGPRSHSAGFGHIPVYVWWLTQTKVFTLYLKLVAWPWPLSVHYDIPFLKTLAAAWPWLAGVSALAVITMILLWKNRPAGFVLASVFLILSPTLVVPIVSEIAAERRMYLPLAGLAALAVVGGFDLMRRAVRKREPGRQGEASHARTSVVAAAVPVVLLAVIYGSVSWQRLALFKDPAALWRDVLERYPQDAVAHANLGTALSNQGQELEATAEYLEALRIDPGIPTARRNLAETQYGAALRLLDQGKPEEATPLLEKALQIDPEFADAHYALAGVLGARGDLRAAARHYAEAVEFKPRYVEALVNLGLTRLNLGEIDLAVAAFHQATNAQSANADAHFFLAVALTKQAKLAEAAGEFQRTLQCDPDRADAHFELANLLVAQNRFQEAARHYADAVRLRPGYIDALQNLGAVLLMVGDVPGAIRQFEEVLRLEPSHPEARANLEQARQASQQRGP